MGERLNRRDVFTIGAATAVTVAFPLAVAAPASEVAGTDAADAELLALGTELDRLIAEERRLLEEMAPIEAVFQIELEHLRQLSAEGMSSEVFFNEYSRRSRNCGHDEALERHNNSVDRIANICGLINEKKAVGILGVEVKLRVLRWHIDDLLQREDYDMEFAAFEGAVLDLARDAERPA